MDIIRTIILFVITLGVSLAITIFFVTNYIEIGTTQLSMESTIYASLAMLSIYNLPIAEKRNGVLPIWVVNNFGRSPNYVNPKNLTNKAMGYATSIELVKPEKPEEKEQIVVRKTKIEIEPVFIFVALSQMNNDIYVYTAPNGMDYNDILNKTPTFCFPMIVYSNDSYLSKIRAVCSTAKISIEEIQ